MANCLHLFDHFLAFDYFPKNHMLPIQPGEKNKNVKPTYTLWIAICSLVSILPLSISSANKKLGSIGIGPSIGHWQYHRSCVLQCEVFICKLFPVDGFSSGSVAFCKISTLIYKRCVVTAGRWRFIFGQQQVLLYLAHEFRDDSMKVAALIAKPLLSSAQGTEVFCRIKAAILWNTQVTIYWFLNNN